MLSNKEASHLQASASLDQTVASSSSASKDVAWDRVLAALTPQLFEDLQRRDATTVRTALANQGFLDVLLHGKMTEQEWSEMDTLPRDEYKLFLAAQVATQYLSRTLGAMRERETSLRNALRDIERKIHETHSVYERVRAERKRVAEELKQVDLDIAECDRQLKAPPPSSATSPVKPQQSSSASLSSSWRNSHLRLEGPQRESTSEGAGGGEDSIAKDQTRLTTTQQTGANLLVDQNSEDSDEDSPWEEHPMRRADHPARSSAVFGSMASSPLARSSVVSSNLVPQDSNSPKHSRSRASSGGTSGGVTDEEFVLFASTNNAGWFQDKLKDAFKIKKGPLEDINETGNGDDVDEENDEFF